MGGLRGQNPLVHMLVLNAFPLGGWSRWSGFVGGMDPCVGGVGVVLGPDVQLFMLTFIAYKITK
jgi:hypothetical protein